MAEKKLYLIDSFALIYRAYYAFINNPLINSKGLNVSAVTGFTSTVFDIINKEKPTHIAAAFDTSDESTERAQEFSYYKANRQKTPEDISISIPIIKEVLRGMKIPILEVPGFEADDIIGTIAKEKAKEGFEVYMVTPDKDFAQLVDDNIYLYKPGRSGKPAEILGIPEVLKKWNVDRPEQIIDILGMWGDAVDNIPGIPGIGEKTAKKLVKEYGSMEGLLENVNQLKGKQQENVINFAQQGLDSKMLATIVLDVPVKVSNDDLKIVQFDKEILTPLFNDLEFRTLGKRILGEDYNVNSSSGAEDDSVETGPKNLSNTDHTYHLIDSQEGIEKLAQDIMNQKSVCFDTETTGVDPNNCELVGIAFSWKNREAYYVPLSQEKKTLEKQLSPFIPFFTSEEIEKIAHNLKYDALVLKWYGIEIKGPIFDTMIAHYTLNSSGRHGMDLLAENYLNYNPQSIEELIGPKGKDQISMRFVDIEKVKEYAAEDADITFQLKQKFEPELKSYQVDKLYRNVEAPLIPVLTQMEFNGVRIDTDFLSEYSTELLKIANQEKAKVFKIAGEEFNLNSPKQLGEILFDKMQIPYTGKKTKTGQYSTNEEVLVRLAGENEIANTILAYREVTKLRSTYVEALPGMINSKTGRIHSSFRQAVVPTGRLSSDKPNLQNIPIRTERGRKIREAFIPQSDDYILLSADYSQVELRIIADLAQDPGMMEAFANGEDIHASTASKVFGVPLESVDREMRRKAKAVNFGLAYGQGAFGLAQNLNISRSEAKEIIDNYFEKYSGIKAYMERSKEFAKKHGYVKTILGRKRELPDINSKNHTVRSFAERNAINTPIQGSAADVIKLAMINIHNELQKRELKSYLILQVHDELVFEVPKKEKDEMLVLIPDLMSNAVQLSVPLEVDTGFGNNWLEAH